MKKFRIILLLLGFTWVVGGAILVKSKLHKERFVEVSEKSLPKSVSVYVSGLVYASEDEGLVENSPGMLIGAGVFVSPNNHILTCHHLFHYFKKLTGITVCNSDGQCTAAELLATEPKLDLAIIQGNFDQPTPYIQLADPRKLQVGQEVIAIGTPLGLSFTVTHGIVSALNRDQVGIYNMSQSDTFINPGNSGGPLINLDGQLVGINSRILPPVPANIFTGLGFSVQSGQIIEFLTRFRQKYEFFPTYNHLYWTDK